VGFIELGAQPLALELDHRGFFFPPGARTAEEILLAGAAVGMGHEFDFDAFLHLRPVLLLEQLRLELPELALGRADQITRAAVAQKLEVFLADHPAIHHPDAFGLAVFAFHQSDHLFDGGHVGGVAGEDFVADRQTFGCDHRGGGRD